MIKVTYMFGYYTAKYYKKRIKIGNYNEAIIREWPQLEKGEMTVQEFLDLWDTLND
jgi:hypothetical protein